MYDSGIGKDVVITTEDESNHSKLKETEQRSQIKASKTEKLTKQHVENERRAKKSEEKWAKATRKIIVRDA